MKNEWDKIFKDGHALYIGKFGFDTLRVELDDFWRLLFRDILPGNRGVDWNHLKIHLEGSDGRFTCYPHHSGSGESQICRAWATVGVTLLAKEFQKLSGKVGFEKKSKVIYDKYAEAIAEAAGRVVNEQGSVSQTAEPLSLRFHIYHDLVPFREVKLET
jgi:hypothetical protein